MNFFLKSLLLFALSFFSITTTEAGPRISEDIEIRLERQNHLGLSRIDIVELRNGNYFFNGKKLGTRLPPRIQKAWLSVRNKPKTATPPLLCDSGKFVYTRVERSQSETFSGCTDGAKYGELLGQLQILRDFAKGK